MVRLVVSRSSGQILAVCLLSVLTQVSGSIFQLKLVSFANDQGKDVSGHCCSGSLSNDTCGSPCRTFFRVCLKNYQAQISTDDACIFGEVETPVLGNNSFPVPESDTDPFVNPIKMPLDFTWPDTFSLIIEAFHSDAVTPSGLPDPGSPRKLIARQAMQRFAPIGNNWIQENFRSEHVELAFAFRITCEEHYYGDRCTDFCKPRDDRLGHYTCDDHGNKMCLPGWRGDSQSQYCTIPVCGDGCSTEHGYCDAPGECKCRVGFQGEFCDDCTVYPGCQHGYCIEPFSCYCEEGWGGSYCNQDLIFCTNHHPCRNGGTCHNTGPGTYTCTCEAGYTGKDCEVQIDNCIENPCQNGGVCENLLNDYSCQCPHGFIGLNCEIKIESCLEEPCLNGGTCIPDGAGFTCNCVTGFTGLRCDVQSDHCSSSPCENGATCIDVNDGFSCQCAPGYYGLHCENHMEYCDPSPCQNGATCNNGPDTFYCQCVPGYIGFFCEKDFDECELLPCANGGTCTDLLDDFSCQCPIGFSGKDCSIPLDLCASDPCQNGGTCDNHINGYTCTCPEGFGGRNCDRFGMEGTTAEATEAVDTTSLGDNGAPGGDQVTTTTTRSNTVTVAASTIYSTTVATTTDESEATSAYQSTVSASSPSSSPSTEELPPAAAAGNKLPISTMHLIAIFGAVAVIVPVVILTTICVVYRRRRRKSKDEDEESSSSDNKMNNRRCENDLKAMRGKEVAMPPASISIKVCNEECSSLKQTNREHLKKLKEFENDFKAEKALQQNAQLIGHELSSKGNHEIAKPVNSGESSSQDYKSSKGKHWEQSPEKIQYLDSIDSVHYKVSNTIKDSTSRDRRSQYRESLDVCSTWKEDPSADYSGNTVYLLEDSPSPRATEV